MIVSLYKHGAKTLRPHPHTLRTFEDLAHVLGDSHDVLAPNEKDKTPVTQEAFAPCEFDGEGREIKNVLRVHFGAVDVDKKPLDHVQRVLTKFSALKSFVYSTYSHGKPGVPGVSMRWVFPFSRPIEVHGDTAREWEPYIAGFQQLTDNLIDTEKDPTRLFFVPTRRPGSESFESKPFLLYHAGEGQPLNVDAVIELGRSLLATKGKGATHRRALTSTALEVEDKQARTLFTVSELRDLATTLRRSKSNALKELGKVAAKVADGKTYTEEANRDDCLFRLCSQIAECFPYADPVAVARVFETSIETTNLYHKSGNTADDLDKVVEKLTRQQEKVRFRLEQQKEAHEKALRADISAAFAAIGIDRDHPYTEDELERIKRDVGATSFEELDRLWIIQHGTSFYLNVAGEYRPPIPERSLSVCARRDLAPAVTAGVQLLTVDDNGNAAMISRDLLLARHATVARASIVDLNAQRAHYDRTTQIITEAPCPVRGDIVPTRHAHLEEWITALAGSPENARRLLQWVSFVTHLDRPCVALYLDGLPGVGKTLFAKALSRIWTKGGPTELKKAAGNFNELITYCPLVFADETIPRDILGESTTMLREFQQNTSRPLNRKHIPHAQMIGAIRLIMASNNKYMIQTDESLTDADIEAISERILYLNADVKARDILRGWGDEACASIVTDDTLAAHALWMRENIAHAQAPRGRFMIQNAAGHNELSRALTTHSGDRAVVCHWLVSYLQKPIAYDAKNAHLIHIRQQPSKPRGALWVNVQGLVDDWDVYVTNTKPPKTHRIGQAVRGISHGERAQARINGTRVNYYVIDEENLITWAEENGISSREQIEAALSTPTKISGMRRLSAVSSENERDTAQQHHHAAQQPNPFTTSTNKGQQP